MRTQRPDGSYRAIAARAVPGRPIGGFRYYGTRPDDPNDVVPHEHRRELRALKVFGAWANLVDMKAGNTLDTVIVTNGRGVVRHYLQDVGSTFGTGAAGPREYDEGWEYLYETGPTVKRLFSLGFSLSPWQTVQYEELPEIGRFEGEQFDPAGWRPRVPTAAFRKARLDDTFWAARRVAAFTKDMIETMVRAAEYSNPVGRGAVDLHAPAASAENPRVVLERGQPAGGLHARGEGRAELRQCGGRCRCGERPRWRLPRRLGTLRQRDRADETVGP